MSKAHEYQEIILFHLEKVKNSRPDGHFRALQRWQANRLLETHQELYRQAQFQPAMDFFKDELYSAEHFLRRNDQIIRALPLMCKTMPDTLLEIVASAAELHSLSLELDALLLHHLPTDLSINDLTLPIWVEAYGKSDNQTDRDRQLDLIELLGNELKRAVGKPMIRPLLSWAKTPARLAGYQDIHQFVFNGYEAFAYLDNPDDFLIPVLQTERALSKEWFISRHSD